MAADCKSARESVRWFESSPAHQFQEQHAGGMSNFETLSHSIGTVSIAAVDQPHGIDGHI
jgi:hypothetical protein